MIREYTKHIYQNKLLSNSLLLMLATGFMAILGFVFWFMAARVLSAADVGLAATLIAVMNLIATLSLFGFDITFVRFLPTFAHKNTKINTGLIVVACAAMILATIFVILVPLISPPLIFVRAHILIATSFVFFCIVTALTQLSASVFIADGRAQYTLYINTIFSAFRLLLALILFKFAALGIFFAVGLSQFIGFGLSIAAMMWKFDFVPTLTVSKNVLSQAWKYSMSNYAAGVFNLLPPAILPIIIINNLGPDKAGFFNIATMVGSLLYSIPWSSARSLLAESSREEHALVVNVKKAAKTIAILLIPPSVVLFFAGDYLLLLFGKSYSVEGFSLLRLIVLTGAAVSTLSLLETFFRIRNNPAWLVVIHFSFAATIVGLSYALLPFGLTGIGVAWLSGHLVATAVSYIILKTIPGTQVQRGIIPAAEHYQQ